MKSYISIPTKIEAVQWTGEPQDLKDIPKTVYRMHSNNTVNGFSGLQVWNHLESQWINVPTNHYIIKGSRGEYYPCDPEVFAEKYKSIVKVKSTETTN